MKYWIQLIICTLAIANCSVKKGNHKIKWTESQALCIYWVPDFEGRDTLSAINFVLQSSSDNIFSNAEFSFIVGKRKYQLTKAKLVNKGKYQLQGLKLECRFLFDDFNEDIYIEDGPCFQESLVKMINEGRLYFKSRDDQKLISKSDLFVLQKGLKD